MERMDASVTRHGTIAIFGATGTAGDGVLKAAMNDSDVGKVHVITRRPSPRIESGIASGQVRLTTHTDYLDYSSIGDLLEDVETVFWALGTSAANVTKEEYGVIHVDFPVNLAMEWLRVSKRGEISFHFISGMGAAAQSRMHWAREKARAEQALFDLAEGSPMRVISYRPSYIVPSEERAKFGHNWMNAIFAPISLAVRSTVIGEAMLEVSARGSQLANGTILENRDVVKYGNSYHERRGSVSD